MATAIIPIETNQPIRPQVIRQSPAVKNFMLLWEKWMPMAALAIFFSTFYTSFTALPSIAGLNSHRRSKLRREN